MVTILSRARLESQGQSVASGPGCIAQTSSEEPALASLIGVGLYFLLGAKSGLKLREMNFSGSSCRA